MLKLNLNVYLSRTLVHIVKTFMKLNIRFCIKDDELLEKYNKIWEKVKNSIKNNLLVKQ